MAGDVPDVFDLLERPAWHTMAKCRGAGTAQFFGSERADVAANAICDRCWVEQDCLEAALGGPEYVGIWGGTTDNERARMRKDRTSSRVPDIAC